MTQALHECAQLEPTSEENRWMHPERILVATDLEDLDHLLPTAAEQATFHRAELLLVHVLPCTGISSTPPSLLLEIDPREHLQMVERKLAQACALQGLEHCTCSYKVLEGDVPASIAQLATDWKADRILVGSHGAEKFYLRLLGSNAEKVFRLSPVPVMVLGPKIQLPRDTAQRKVKILLPVSLKGDGQFLFRYGVLLAASDNLAVTLLHVVEERDGSKDRELTRAACREEMLFHIHSISSSHPPECIVKAGEVTDAILSEAKNGEYDFIVMGNITNSVFLPKLLATSAYGVLCEAPCAVLVVRESVASS